MPGACAAAQAEGALTGPGRGVGPSPAGRSETARPEDVSHRPAAARSEGMTVQTAAAGEAVERPDPDKSSPGAGVEAWHHRPVSHLAAARQRGPLI